MKRCAVQPHSLKFRTSILGKVFEQLLKRHLSSAFGYAKGSTAQAVNLSKSSYEQIGALRVKVFRKTRCSGCPILQARRNYPRDSATHPGCRLLKK
jgi:hypothetical protein